MLIRLPVYLHETPERTGDLYVDPSAVKGITPSGLPGCSVLTGLANGPQVLVGEPYDIMALLFPDDTPEGRRLRVEHDQEQFIRTTRAVGGVGMDFKTLPPLDHD